MATDWVFMTIVKCGCILALNARAKLGSRVMCLKHNRMVEVVAVHPLPKETRPPDPNRNPNVLR